MADNRRGKVIIAVAECTHFSRAGLELFSPSHRLRRLYRGKDGSPAHVRMMAEHEIPKWVAFWSYDPPYTG